jgi:triacylglycerol lipase
MTVILWVELLIELALSSGATLLLAHHADVSPVSLWYLPVGVFLTLRIGLVVASCVVVAQQEQRPPLSVAAWGKLVALESVAFLRFCWLMLSEFRSTAAVATIPEAPSTVVVLLHGVLCNRGIWRPVLHDLEKHSEYAVIAPNLTPVMAGLEMQARVFARWLDALIGVQGERRVVVVGHSMGGLIARLCLAQGLTTTRLHKLICIGTPHAGSEIARIVPGAVGRDLRTHSAVLSKLNRAASVSTTALVNVYSRHDNLVLPFRSAHLRGAVNIEIDAIGHMSMIYSKRIQTLIADELRIP